MESEEDKSLVGRRRFITQCVMRSNVTEQRGHCKDQPVEKAHTKPQRYPREKPMISKLS
ncbi:MAG: hypothetical protein BMS9Abin02_1559 [Anaerolineae bacterium]|nr:MAG: hypothetical protein BMS9Abin02_1559 [Anaerolineae bacterium]